MKKRTKRTIILSISLLSLLSVAFLYSQYDSLSIIEASNDALALQEVNSLTDSDIIEYLVTKFVQVFIFNS